MNQSNADKNQPEKKESFFKKVMGQFPKSTFKVSMFPYIFKRIGFWIAISTIGIAVLFAILKGLFDIPSPLALIRPFPQILFMIGLWLITNSEEKIDDEGVKADRLLSYQFSYTVMVLFLIFTLIQNSIFKSTIDVSLDEIIASLLFIYLLAFNILKFKRNERSKQDEDMD